MSATEYLPIAKMIVLFALLVVSAYTDLAQGKLFNKVTLTALVLGLVLNYWIGGFWPARSARSLITDVSLMSSLVGAGIGGGLLLIYYLKGGIAGGDVKLMTAVGAIGTLKSLYIVYALLYASLIGGFMAIALLIWKGRLREKLKQAARFMLPGGKKPAEEEPEQPRLTIPYGFAIAAGSLLAWFVTSGLL